MYTLSEATPSVTYSTIRSPHEVHVCIQMSTTIGNISLTAPVPLITNTAWTSSIVFKKQFYSALMHPSLDYGGYYSELLMASAVALHVCLRASACVP